MNLSGNNIKIYILRRYSIDELESIFNQKLNNQSRNFKHYAHMSSNKFMAIVVSLITEEILVQLTDGWVEDSPIPEEGLYEFIEELFGERIIKKYDELRSMNLQESIRRILREELYSPASDEHTPGKFIVHKSNPVWRDNIELTGLQVSVGDCYQQHVGGDEECKPSIFATDSLDKEQMFDSTYDDDIWIINTECAEVTWYKDRHIDNGDYKHHIVTFENISPECLRLLHKGTGKSY